MNDDTIDMQKLTIQRQRLEGNTNINLIWFWFAIMTNFNLGFC